MNELAVAIILLLTGFLFSLELRRRRLAEARLQEALASVEHQVAERTDALSKAMAELKISEQQVANIRFAAVKKIVELVRAANLSADVFPELRQEVR